MSDIIDDANNRAQEILDAALAKRKPAGPPPCGYCYNCNEELATGLRFCDNDCRDDHSRRVQVELDKAGRYLDE